MPHLTKGVIREAYEDDIPAIIDLYRRLNDPNILPRSHREYEAAIRSGGFFIVTARNLVVAASGVFPVSRDPFYVEFGGTAVDFPERGFKLQDIFLATRICWAVIFFPKKLPGCVYSFADPVKNEASVKNIKNCGFVLADDVPEPYLKACMQCKKHLELVHSRRCCCDFFAIPEHRLVPLVRYFLDASPERTNSRGDILRLESRLFPDATQRSILTNFANSRNSPTG